METTEQTLAWAPDAALEGFEAANLSFPADDEGPVVVTLVRRRSPAPRGRAVLYVHGFNDYFFQAHMAEEYVARGYDFYALDLRKYGRSIRPGQTPNFCRDLREYYAELDAAVDAITLADGHGWLLLSGHSTGGLLCSLYAHEGARRARLSALHLNSPFFDLNLSPWQRTQAALACRIGGRAPRFKIPGGLSTLYTESVHRDYRGEWDFSLEWKPLAGFPSYAGWLRAVVQGQERLQAGLRVACPVLLQHSARSVIPGPAWSDELLSADAVLDVAHMRIYGPAIGRDVTLVAVEGGLHDLVLSAQPVRERVFAELFAWLDARQ